MRLLQEQLLEQQYPDQVKPTERDTAGDGDENADDEAQNAALFQPCGPSDQNFRDPVDTGDQKQKDLHQSALFVKPSH